STSDLEYEGLLHVLLHLHPADLGRCEAEVRDGSPNRLRECCVVAFDHFEGARIHQPIGAHHELCDHPTGDPGAAKHFGVTWPWAVRKQFSGLLDLEFEVGITTLPDRGGAGERCGG